MIFLPPKQQWSPLFRSQWPRLLLLQLVRRWPPLQRLLLRLLVRQQPLAQVVVVPLAEVGVLVAVVAQRQAGSCHLSSAHVCGCALNERTSSTRSL